ncbi:DUF2334 domain-containing protein [Clostridium fungisolvens]|uniref:DUF2334 domain-containing protein n=1 Tax=Clostridium fungisolvens TaxID=1604897 RepID=A0A6V8SQ31_9CLOT|nr:DUF2334 domain-containing protein [Clostridium fungisolvens]GFP76963.1 hypothetical protein bsdtw1_03075 [Clostridium fungisolvens]
MVYEKQLSLIEANLKINFEGKSLKFIDPIYRDINRYFLPFLEFIKQIKGKFNITRDKINIRFKHKSPIYINYKTDNYKFTVINYILYLSLFDICTILNAKSSWDYNSESISLYWNKDKSEIYTIPSGKVALIRFEDVTAGDEYLSSDNLEKFRVIADFMFSAGVPFHIAWIPRFVDPPNSIDNDISKHYSLTNANFLFTIEYLLNRGGQIGLHGYTHQYGYEVSAEGTEFNEERNNDEKCIRKRVEAAINTAKKLELPFKFFESPHYAATEFQQSIFEQYFGIIYEDCVGIWGDKIVKSPRNHRTLYIPTPLSYVEGKDGTEKMLDRINNLDEETLASLFYHPYKDFEYITLKNSTNGYPLSEYSESSPLHQIVKALFDKKYSFSKITSLSINNEKNPPIKSFFNLSKLYSFLKFKIKSIK